ncbi:hypothetical protein LJC44_04340 [Parabacteroides sp. OttesenSCG-928-G06]|nr:hypothetical protein [Parabacteroides sp. OttesenSCG-928-G06]
MSLELSKSQKKIARELIGDSLQKECGRFIEEVKVFIPNQEQESKNPHEIYLNLYKKVKSFDKHIARRYDDLRGTTYYRILVGLLLDEIITSEDLNRFDEEMKNRLLNTVKLWSDDSE